MLLNRLPKSKLKQKTGKISTDLVESLNITTEIDRYVAEIQMEFLNESERQALKFLNEKTKLYPDVAPIAQDLLAAPASQAYIEIIFSLCGLLTCGRRNRLSKSLEMREFLRLNSTFIPLNTD